MSIDPLQAAVGAGAYEAAAELAPQTSIPLGPYTASGAILTGAGYLCGWSVAETSGSAAAAVRFWDGAGTNGQQIARVGVVQSDSKDAGPFVTGLYCPRGLYLQVVSGAAEVTVYWRYAR
jgi:hypothetical protein